MCLRLASGPAQPATRHPASGPSVYETATRPSTAQPSPFQAQPASGLSNMPETGLRPTTSLTCLRLVSSYASYQACLTCPSPPVRLPKQLSRLTRPCPLLVSGPKSSSRPSPDVSRYASLRLASGPVPQPACWRVYWGYFSGALKQMEVCIPTMYLSWAEQPRQEMCVGMPPVT